MLEAGIRLWDRARASSIVERIFATSMCANWFVVHEDDVSLGFEAVTP